MQSIYICAASLCCCLVVCAILRMIVPSGNTQKIMSVVIGVFTVCCLLSPLYEIGKNLNFSENKNDEINRIQNDYEQQYDSKVLQTTAEYINEYVNSLLFEAGVNDARIETILSVNDGRGIYIQEMNIYLYKKNGININGLSDLIYSSVGIVPSITECNYE